MYFDSQLPPDPFANDPNDPASFFEEETPPPLSLEDIANLNHDLELVREFKKALQPRGINGVVFTCDDCQEFHYFDWDIIAANIRATLAEQVPPIHEPSAQPNIESYVPWDYAMGYLDGFRQR
ncbi:DUF5319 domain-containing protein [Corynebacterium caspium]|uniref:DUF5319 domain-containing protein n=1 Tax=Corynebacterium caspium TaxID=234828 RepID=UPI0003766507|nr:DUF5319 domain-containing protein [Corynebacterium caspium]WKD59787.1 hypothetical protein CCASP_07040 [Corynebacterium caspium DSM 44850]